MQAGQPLKPFAVISPAQAKEAEDRAQRLVLQAKAKAERDRMVAAWQAQWKKEFAEAQRKLNEQLALQQAVISPVVTEPGPAGTVRVR
jgi:hypothetical protein